MFRFELGQVVYYCIDGVIHSAPIYTRMAVENLHDDWNATSEQRRIFTFLGNSCIKYRTMHGLFNETDIYATSEQAAYGALERVS
jgi:hypothetical protein